MGETNVEITTDAETSATNTPVLEIVDELLGTASEEDAP